MVAEKAYNSIKIELAYDYNVNDVYFDGIQLYREQFGNSYTYDSYHNVTKAVIEEGLTYEFAYDAYGNNTSVSIVSGGTRITSTATYSNSGDTLATTKDALGNITTYTYNANTNVLESVRYPEDTTATQTNYTYDSMYRLATTAAATGTGTALPAAYTYTNDMLKKIQTGSTAYTFTYDTTDARHRKTVGIHGKNDTQ